MFMAKTGEHNSPEIEGQLIAMLEFEWGEHPQLAPVNRDAVLACSEAAAETIEAALLSEVSDDPLEQYMVFEFKQGAFASAFVRVDCGDVDEHERLNNNADEEWVVDDRREREDEAFSGGVRGFKLELEQGDRCPKRSPQQLADELSKPALYIRSKLKGFSFSLIYGYDSGVAGCFSARAKVTDGQPNLILPGSLRGLYDGTLGRELAEAAYEPGAVDAWVAEFMPVWQSRQ
jgi:hypothetical protein